MAASGRAQISNVSSDLVYNNVEEAWNSSYAFIGFQQQFDVEENPPTTTLTSPVADYTFTNPVSGGTGELKGSSSATSALSSTASSALLSANGFASAEIISQDPTSTYWSSTSGGVDLYLHLTTDAQVTFSVNSFNTTSGGCQFGANGTYVADFLTSGDQSATKIMGPGSYDFFMFFFTGLPTVNTSTPTDISSYVSGNYSISVQSVPEPAPFLGLGLGVVGLGLIRRRRK